MKPLLVVQHAPHEGVGRLGEVFVSLGVPWRTVLISRGRPSLPSVRSVSGVVVMGGPMGVYETDRHPFLRREVAYVRRAVKAGVPTWGICLGAQVIAAALGARVYPHRVKEIGWHDIRLTAAGKKDPLLRDFPSTPMVFQWHGDTFDLPAGARRLAGSDLCRQQAFGWGRHVYGFQFHVEVDPPMIRSWLSQPGADREMAAAGPGTRRNVIASMGSRCAALNRLSDQCGREFVALLRKGVGS